jgi:hypothetical protein
LEDPCWKIHKPLFQKLEMPFLGTLFVLCAIGLDGPAGVMLESQPNSSA